MSFHTFSHNPLANISTKDDLNGTTYEKNWKYGTLEQGEAKFLSQNCAL